MLTLIAKVIQNIANGTADDIKEAYMIPMQVFLKTSVTRLKAWIDLICDDEPVEHRFAVPVCEYDFIASPEAASTLDASTILLSDFVVPRQEVFSPFESGGAPQVGLGRSTSRDLAIAVKETVAWNDAGASRDTAACYPCAIM